MKVGAAARCGTERSAANLAAPIVDYTAVRWMVVTLLFALAALSQ